MSYFSAVHGYWLWYVWAVIAIVVVIGYVRVRYQLNKAERAGDAAQEEAKRRHAAEHEKRKHKGVE